MLLLSALLLTSGYGTPLAENPASLTGGLYSDRIDASPLSVTVISSENLAGIPNPRDPGSVIDAIRTLEFSSQGVAVRGATLPGPQISLRSGMPSVQFNFDYTPTSLLDVNGLREVIDRADVLGGKAAGSATAQALYGTHSQTMTWLQNQRSRATFDAPSEPDVWCKAEYSLSSTTLTLECKYSQTTHYPTIDFKEETVLGSYNINLGTFNLPFNNDSPKITKEDPSISWQLSDPYQWQIGGINFQGGFAGRLSTSYLTLPYKQFTPKLEVATTPTQYIADAGFHHSAQYIQNLINRSGYSLPEISNLMQGAAPQGTSMNSMQFPGTPSMLEDVDCGSELYFPSGTLWVPDRPGYQVMSNFQPFKYQFAFESHTSGPVSFTQEQIEFRTHCLNMEKRQPAAGVRYYPYYSPDPVIRALMIMTNNTRIRGPWLQAQTWIYTDKASLEDINKMLVPPVSAARYVEGLYAVANAGGFTNQDYLNAAMFNPTLLSAVILRPEIAYWMLLVMAEYHAEATRRWFENAGGNIGAILSGDDEQAKSVVMKLIALAIYSPTPLIRMGVLTLLERLQNGPSLMRVVPTPYYSLASEDNAEVALAERVIERYSLR